MFEEHPVRPASAGHTVCRAIHQLPVFAEKFLELLLLHSRLFVVGCWRHMLLTEKMPQTPHLLQLFEKKSYTSVGALYEAGNPTTCSMAGEKQSRRIQAKGIKRGKRDCSRT